MAIAVKENINLTKERKHHKTDIKVLSFVERFNYQKKKLFYTVLVRVRRTFPGTLWITYITETPK
jgi:hypothetical protein